MNKLCNFRPILFICLSALSALIFSYFMLIGKFFVMYIALALFVLLTVLILLNYKTINKKHIITLIICLLCFALFFSSFQIHCKTFNVKDIPSCQITGYVSQINNSAITLTKVNAGNIKLQKNVTIYYYGETEIKAGNYIKFNAKLEKTPLVSNSEINLSMITYNTAYSASISNIEVLSYKPTIQMVVKEYVANTLSKNYSSKNSALVFAMLFGDKSQLKEFDVTSYNEIGLAHIFAVSGLHISIIFMIIAFFMSALKIKGKINFIITAIISLFYCYLCGFSASVVRATVMSLCLIYASVVKKQPDSLNAYCVAILILSLMNPCNFLLKGFQLSFLCVFAILSISPILTKMFSKIMPKKMASSLSVSISAFVGTLIVLVQLYGFFNALTVLFNMFMIPIFSALFVIIFTFALITSIVPIFGIINQAPNFLLTIYNNITEILAKIPSSINLSNLGVICLLSFIILLFMMGNFCLLKGSHKLLISVFIFAICITSAIINVLPKNYSYVSVTAIRSTYENCYFLTSTDNSRIIITNNLNNRSIKTINEYITNNNINHLSAVITRKNNASQTQLELLLDNTNCDKIITLEDSTYDTFEEYEMKTIGNIKLSVLGMQLKEDVFVATINNKNVLFCFSTLNGAQQQELFNYYYEFQTICSKSEKSTQLEAKNYLFFNQTTDYGYSTVSQEIITLKYEGEV